jgi:hypothetical protein
VNRFIKNIKYFLKKKDSLGTTDNISAENHDILFENNLLKQLTEVLKARISEANDKLVACREQLEDNEKWVEDNEEINTDDVFAQNTGENQTIQNQVLPLDELRQEEKRLEEEVRRRDQIALKDSQERFENLRASMNEKLQERMQKAYSDIAERDKQLEQYRVLKRALKTEIKNMKKEHGLRVAHLTDKYKSLRELYMSLIGCTGPETRGVEQDVIKLVEELAMVKFQHGMCVAERDQLADQLTKYKDMFEGLSWNHQELKSE